MERLSLLLHDILPKNYMKQGTFPNGVTVSYHQVFFSPKDSINISRKKLYTSPYPSESSKNISSQDKNINKMKEKKRKEKKNSKKEKKGKNYS